MKTRARERPETYYTDLSKPQNRVAFPIDFADWLRTRDRDEDAREFVSRVNSATKEATRMGRSYSVKQAVRISQAYARVIDLSEVDDHHQEAIDLLSAVQLGGDTDRETSGMWDREKSTQRQMEEDAPVLPLDLNTPECPEVEVMFFEDEDLMELAAKTLVQLTVQGYGRQAKQFAQDVLFALRLPDEAEHLFTLIWSYVTVVPEVDLWVDDVA